MYNTKEFYITERSASLLDVQDDTKVKLTRTAEMLSYKITI